MGKKSWEDLDYFQKQNKLDKMGELVGISRSDYRNSEGESGRYYGSKGSYDDYEKDILSAMNNNFDVRTSMMYSDDDEGPTAINKSSEAFDVYKSMKKSHKDAGNTGNFSSANDLANVSKSAHSSYMDKFREGIMNDMPKPEESDDSDSGDDGPQQGMSFNEATESGTLSPDVQAALDRQSENDYMFELKKATDNTPTTTPASEAQNFLQGTVRNLASNKEAINKSKEKEKTYNGIFNAGPSISLMNPMG